MAIMRLLALWQGMPLGTAQTVRMQHAHQKVITALLVKQIVYGKDQHGSSVDAISVPVNHFTWKAQ